MRVIMVGTGPFAIPTFQGLLASRHEVPLLVASPLRLCRGKIRTQECPMRLMAQELGVPVFDPENINSPESIARLQQEAADVLVVCDYGQILSCEALSSARLGGINLHGSLLPKYRGAAPINWALYHGEMTTGVTVIHMTPTVDAGPCIAKASTPIDPEETAVELESRLCQLGAPLVLQVLDDLETDNTKSLAQDPNEASRAPRLKKKDGQIDWTRSAEAVRNHIRAMEPWPKTYTFWHRPCGEPLRLILGPIGVVDLPMESENVVPGTVVQSCGDRLVVAAGQRAVLLSGLQPAGKRMLSIDEFLRGYPIKKGERFGPTQG